MATGRIGGLAGAPAMTSPNDKDGQRLSAEQTQRLLRWRMALGRYADNRLGSSGLSAEDMRRDHCSNASMPSAGASAACALAAAARARSTQVRSPFPTGWATAVGC